MKQQPWISLFALALMIAAQLAVASTSNKWRLEFSGGADSDGTIVIRLSPKEGEALEASVDI